MKKFYERIIGHARFLGKQTTYYAELTADTAADIPDPAEHPEWEVGSELVVLENGGSKYKLSNARQWVQVNFKMGQEGGENGDSGGYGDIPMYHFEESGRLIDLIVSFKAAHPQSLIFGAVSDIHVLNADETYEEKSKTSIKHAAFALEMVGAMAGCDFVANLGDNCWENGIDTDNALSGARYAINALQPAFARITSYNLVGNHDTSNDTQKIYNLIGKYNDFDDYGLTQIRGFGYKDFTDKKVRVIVLNTCDYMNVKGGCALSYEQKDFLMRALDLSAKSDDAQWQILLLSHIPLDWNGGDYNYYADLQTILNAYENGTTASISVNSSYAKNETPSNYATYSNGNLVYHYSGKNSAKIIANIHGHVHTNRVSKLANTDIARVATANTNPDLNKSESYPTYGDYSITAAEAAKIVKVFGTAKDTSATFCCIDLEEQMIYAFGYGADTDRTVYYGKAVEYSVTCNLTDVTTSNTASVVVEGSSYSAKLSVGKDYSIDTVTVTMGGVDITATAYTDGSIHIAEVTGNIVITAIAKDNYVPHWDIIDRTAVSDMYKGPNDKKDLSRKHYYVGATSTGAVYHNAVSNLSVNGNDVTFTTSSKDMGIGLPYHLESGKTYVFSATASIKSRIRWCWLNADGTFGGESGYSGSGTNLTVEFTAPADEAMWVMVILDVYAENDTTSYTNVSLTKKS